MTPFEYSVVGGMEFKSLTHANKYIEDLVLQQVPPKENQVLHLTINIFVEAPTRVETLSQHQSGP